MSETTLTYAEHIHDPERINLARTLLEKESRKLFLDLPGSAWQNIDRSIQGWAEAPLKYHLEDDGPRDFWDSFAAIVESIKLKPNFTTWITAENVQWHKATLPVRKIQMTSPLGQLKKMPGIDLRNNLPFAELEDALDQHPKAREEQKQLVDEHSTDPDQDTYPIIVREGEDGLFKVMDGNRRTLKAVIYGNQEIEAWIGTLNGREPINYWVPLNDMLQLVKIFKGALDNDDKVLRHAVSQVLRSQFNISSVAKQSYQNRIGNQSEIAKQLFKLAQQDN